MNFILRLNFIDFIQLIFINKVKNIRRSQFWINAKSWLRRFVLFVIQSTNIFILYMVTEMIIPFLDCAYGGLNIRKLLYNLIILIINVVFCLSLFYLEIRCQEKRIIGWIIMCLLHDRAFIRSVTSIHLSWIINRRRICVIHIIGRES